MRRQAVQEASHLNERVSELQTRCGLLEAAVRERDTEHTRELEQCSLQERSAAQAQAERQVRVVYVYLVCVFVCVCVCVCVCVRLPLLCSGGDRQRQMCV